MGKSNQINIYYDGENYYYRENSPLNKKDKLIETDVSLEFAFNYCQRENFGTGKNYAAKRSSMKRNKTGYTNNFKPLQV